MLNQKTVAKHDEANAAAAARILRNRDAEPVALVLWAETCQRAERASRATLKPLPLQGVTRANN